MVNLQSLKQAFRGYGCQKIYAKILAANDNSKNQVYFGGSFDILNILPITEVITEEAGSWERERFKATLDYSWLKDDGTLTPAPYAQLILYPKYPEVRFSGYLLRSQGAPSALMTQRLPGRILFFSVTGEGMVIGYVSAPDSIIAKEFHALQNVATHGVFSVIDLPIAQNNKERLIAELARIHRLGWIKSKRLDKSGAIVPCESSNCGGYTLEAELGIIPNGYSEPDYLGWEIKQFGVPRFDKIKSSVITLMTPEPTGGIYKTKGAAEFLFQFGYKDKMGREDRWNFGGIHKVNSKHISTGLTMQLIGFDSTSGKIRNASGKIALLDQFGVEAASWDFASMLKHWNRKHNQACYIPSMTNKSDRGYSYGNNVILGTNTDFQLFLKQMDLGNIYYDPGIKIENISTKPKIKRRSQFRIKSGFLSELYNNNEVVDVLG